MNSFHILPDDTVIVCVKYNGSKWQINSKALDLWKLLHSFSDKDFAGRIAPNGMPEMIVPVFWYTYWELETRLIQRDVFPWGIGEKSEAFSREWFSKHKP